MEAWRTEGDFRAAASATTRRCARCSTDAEIAEVFRLERYLGARGRRVRAACSARTHEACACRATRGSCGAAHQRRHPRSAPTWRRGSSRPVATRCRRASPRAPPATLDDRLAGALKRPADLRALPGRAPTWPSIGCRCRTAGPRCAGSTRAVRRRPCCSWPWRCSRAFGAAARTGTPRESARGGVERDRPASSARSSASSASVFIALVAVIILLQHFGVNVAVAGGVARRRLAGHRPRRPGHARQHVRAASRSCSTGRSTWATASSSRPARWATWRPSACAPRASAPRTRPLLVVPNSLLVKDRVVNLQPADARAHHPRRRGRRLRQPTSARRTEPAGRRRRWLGAARSTGARRRSCVVQRVRRLLGRPARSCSGCATTWTRARPVGTCTKRSTGGCARPASSARCPARRVVRSGAAPRRRTGGLNRKDDVESPRLRDPQEVGVRSRRARPSTTRSRRSATRAWPTSGRASSSSWRCPSWAAEEARKAAEEIAHRVLSNPVIESYRVEVEP